jgi:hypothetical protein
MCLATRDAFSVIEREGKKIKVSQPSREEKLRQAPETSRMHHR